ncbi:MAG: CehA/McbA family metallohydrolase [Planctomycetota bacterium]
MRRKKSWIAGCTVAVLGLVVWGQAQDSTPPVEVARLTAENWERFAPAGKEVDAIVGDIVLRNSHLTAVIAQPLPTRHANMTVRQIAGALIDFTTREAPSDQLSAYYPGQRQFAFREWQILGPKNQPLDLESQSHTSAQAVSVQLQAAATETQPAITVTYLLEHDEAFLTVITKFTNPSNKSLIVPLVDDLRIDGGKELQTKSPNGRGSTYWAHDRFWKQAYAIDFAGIPLEINSDTRTSTVKYQISGEDKVTLMPGGEFQFTRWLFVGQDLLETRARVAEMRGGTIPRVQIRIVGEHGAVPQAEVTLRQADQVYGSGWTNDKGFLVTALPPGEYSVSVQAQGIEIAKDLKYRQEKTDDTFQELRISNYSPGKVIAKITDADGQPIPCKVEFLAQKGTPQPNFGPVTAAFGVQNLRYAPQGTFEQTLPAGQYDVTISHGPEFDAIFTTLNIAVGQTAELTGQLQRTVNTQGWISADLHSHSSPSGDNTASQVGRVLNHVCEHLEFVPCTEHNRIDTYEPIIAELGIGRFVGTVSGIELTGLPLPLNHQNAFPMVHRPYAQDGGAPLPDTDPATQIERLALWDKHSEKLVQVNHPDLGWMFYDRDGDGKPDEGYDRMRPHIGALEVHPIDCILERTPQAKKSGMEFNNTIFGWLQLLNQGQRFPGVVNTDAHDNFHGTGWLRNWIQSPTDNPAEVKPLDIVAATSQGRVVMSNGPFLEVHLNESGKSDMVTAGQELLALSGKVQLQVRVQTPNWFDIDHVFVLINGKLAESLDFTREKHPERFGKEGVLKFDQQLEITLPQDAHLIVVAAGEKSTLSRVMGPVYGNVRPVAVSNPIFVDVNNGGITPTRDTLGYPLPQKFTPRKVSN